MNFRGIPPNYSETNATLILILPVSFDATTTWIKGGTLIKRRNLLDSMRLSFVRMKIIKHLTFWLPS